MMELSALPSEVPLNLTEDNNPNLKYLHSDLVYLATLAIVNIESEMVGRIDD